MHELLEGDALLLQLAAQVGHERLLHGLVHLVLNAALETLGQLGCRNLQLVRLVLGATVGRQAIGYAAAQSGRIAVHGQVLGHPFVIDGGDDLFLHLLDGDGAVDGVALVVGVHAGQVEGERLRFAHVHADEMLLEVLGHEAHAGEVRAAFGGQVVHLLAVLEGFERQQEAVAFLHRVRLVRHELRVALGDLRDLLLDLGLLDLERRHGDGHGLVGLQLVVGLRRDANLEREGLAALERTGGLRKSRERRRDVALVDGERHEVLHGLLLHDGVEVLDAQLLLDGLLHGHARRGLHAHLLGEPVLSRREGMADLGGGGYGLQQDASVVELLFGYLHEESPSVSIVKRSL